ncbi:MAG: hypothetical protein ACREMA_04025, partial [Longimicrobiales bacterium]
ADLTALKTALENARAAQRNGASREDLKKIMDEVRAISERLRAAQLELARAIDALLTPEQRASHCVRTPPSNTGSTRR